MKHLLTKLKKAIFDVLESMFFMFPEEFEGGIVIGRKWEKYIITISGEEGYTLDFYFNRNLGRLMAVNYLGEKEANITDQLVDETCKEAVNVITGNLLNNLHINYTIGVPSKVEMDKPFSFQEKAEEHNVITLNIETQPFMVVIKSN